MLTIEKLASYRECGVSQMASNVKKYQVWYANLGEGEGSEQKGHRPVVIIQNDIGNAHSPTTIVAICTTKLTKAKLPTHFWLSLYCGLPEHTLVMCEQIRTIDKTRLGKYVGELQYGEKKMLDKALGISLSI